MAHVRYWLAAGMLALATQGSLADEEAALAALASGKSVPVDAGRVRFRGPGGQELQAGFLNVASFGVSGLVVERVNRSSLRLPGRVAYLLATLGALLSYRARPVRLRLDGALYELHARHVSHGEIYGFVEVDDIIFGERSALLVDPSEEKLKGEFSGVKRTFVPIHSVVRIDEVEREGVNKVVSI